MVVYGICGSELAFAAVGLAPFPRILPVSGAVNRAVCSGLVSGSIPSASGAGVAGRRGWGSRLPVCVGHGITYQALVLAAHVGSADSRILVRLRSRCGAAVVNHV